MLFNKVNWCQTNWSNSNLNNETDTMLMESFGYTTVQTKLCKLEQLSVTIYDNHILVF